MNTVPIHFSELKSCPHCGGDEYFTKDWVEGSAVTKYTFEGEFSDNNSDMYEGLTHVCGHRAYCVNCGAYLGSLKTDELSTTTRKRISKINKN